MEYLRTVRINFLDNLYLLVNVFICISTFLHFYIVRIAIVSSEPVWARHSLLCFLTSWPSWTLTVPHRTTAPPTQQWIWMQIKTNFGTKSGYLLLPSSLHCHCTALLCTLHMQTLDLDPGKIMGSPDWDLQNKMCQSKLYIGCSLMPPWVPLSLPLAGSAVV